MPITH